MLFPEDSVCSSYRLSLVFKFQKLTIQLLMGDTNIEEDEKDDESHQEEINIEEVDPKLSEAYINTTEKIEQLGIQHNFKQEHNPEMNTAGSKEILQCKSCSKTFTSKGPFGKHTLICIDKYNDTNILKCDVCGKIYKSRKPFEKHMSTHNKSEEKDHKLIRNLFDENDFYQDETEELLLEENSSLFDKTLSNMF